MRYLFLGLFFVVRFEAGSSALMGDPALDPFPKKQNLVDFYGDDLPPGAVSRIGTLRWSARIALGVAFSPDGKVLATCNSDFTVRLWEAASGREIRRFTGTFQAPDRVAFSANGKILGACNPRGDYFYWEWETGNDIKRESSENNSLPWLEHKQQNQFFSGDKKRVAFVTTEKNVGVREGIQGKQIGLFGPLQKPGLVALSTNGALLAVEDATDFSIHLWDVNKGKKLGRCQGHQRFLSALVFSPDGKALASGAIDMTARLWDSATGKERWRFRGTGGCIYSVALSFSPDGKTLAAAGWDGVVRLLDATTGKEREPVNKAHFGWVNALAISPDGKTLFVGGEDLSLRVWELTTGKEIRRLREPVTRSFSIKLGQFEDPGSIYGLACSPDGKQLAMGKTHGLTLWNLAAAQAVPRQIDARITFGLAFSPDGRVLASGNVATHLWEVASGRKIREIPFPGQHGVQSLAFSPDGKILATGGPHKNIPLWKVATGTEDRKLEGQHRGYEPCLAFSPCGRLLASTDVGKNFHVWEVASSQRRFSIPGSSEGCVAFSPNGNLLALAGSDKIVHVYDVVRREEIHQFRGHDGWIKALAFVPNGAFLASGSQDGTVLIWDVRSLERKMQRKYIPLNQKEFDSCWLDLAKGKGDRAHHAIRSLVAAGDQSVTFLQQVCPPHPKEDFEKIPQLLRDLDSDQFPIREKAAAQLEIMGEKVVPALLKLQQKPPSLEVSRRVDYLLKKLEKASISPEKIRSLRAVEVLERIATPQAQRVLESLSQGAQEAFLTQDAKNALDRLRRQGKSKKTDHLGK